jgi:hypothetical protein
MKLFVFPVANGGENVSFLSEFRANSPGDAYVQQLCNPATMLLYMTLSECYSQPYTSKRYGASVDYVRARTAVYTTMHQLLLRVARN